MKKFDTVRYKQTQKSRDSSSEPTRAPYYLGIPGQLFCISGAAFLHLQTRDWVRGVQVSQPGAWIF